MVLHLIQGDVCIYLYNNDYIRLCLIKFFWLILNILHNKKYFCLVVADSGCLPSSRYTGILLEHLNIPKLIYVI